MPSIICNSLEDKDTYYTYKIGSNGETCRDDMNGKIEKSHVESVTKFRPCKNGNDRFCIKIKLTLFD
ncbi:MAG: hypothetical protein NXI20_20225 [bacterium]|jgi:hypothetical protein|nr:hypothetical protein [bacterium]